MNQETKPVEKPVKNPELVGKKVIKVRALRNGWVDDRKVIEGEIFQLKEKHGKRRISKYSDYTEDFVNPVSEQFSRFWMMLIKDDVNIDESEQEHNVNIKEAKAEADMLRARNSEAAEKTLTKKKVVKKAPKKPVVEEPTNSDEEVI